MMMFQLSRRAARTLKLQRTAYQPVWAERLRHRRLGAVYDLGLWRVTTTPGELRRLGQRYENDLAAELSAFAQYLPDSPPTVMDIGCGLGAIDLLLSRHYQHQASFVLVDRNEFTSRPYYGFRRVAAAYNSLEDTLTFLRTNGMDTTKVTTVNVACDPFPQKVHADVVLSLLSWGHHYPISTYLDDVTEMLSLGGVLVVDVRKGTDGMALLSERFELELVTEDSRSYRVVGKRGNDPSTIVLRSSTPE
jgi:SAM-dependent methyltransferase